MKYIYILILLLLVTACSDLEKDHNTLTQKEISEGWILLFNGHDLSQWRNYKKNDLGPNWHIQDGAFCMKNEDGGDIITKKEFSNFELKMDWRLSSGGNSGVFLFVNEKGKKIWNYSPEIQICDDNKASDEKKSSGSLYDMVASPEQAKKDLGLWNTLHIFHENGQLRIWQNNIKTVDILIGSNKWNELYKQSKFADIEEFGKIQKGHIALQGHNEIVLFRNVKIKELPSNKFGY